MILSLSLSLSLSADTIKTNIHNMFEGDIKLVTRFGEAIIIIWLHFVFNS